MNTKADYVRNQPQTREHHCHWPGCDRPVPPAMWGCKQHWFSLPKELRDRIWATFKPGQEVNGTPSTAYLDAADAVQKWIKERVSRDQGRSTNLPTRLVRRPVTGRPQGRGD